MYLGGAGDNGRQHIHLLRIEEHKAVNPDLCALQQLRLGNFFRQDIHQIFRITFAAL